MDHAAEPSSTGWTELVVRAIGIAVPASVGLALVLRRPVSASRGSCCSGALSVGVVMAAAGVAELLRQDDPGCALGAWALLVAQQWMVLFFGPLALAPAGRRRSCGSPTPRCSRRSGTPSPAER
jgi:hypothetical protein